MYVFFAMLIRGSATSEKKKKATVRHLLVMGINKKEETFI